MSSSKEVIHIFKKLYGLYKAMKTIKSYKAAAGIKENHLETL